MGKRPSRAQASAESRRGFCFSWRKFPPDLLYLTTQLGSVPKCSFAANGICRSVSSSSSASWYTKSRNMKHGRLASEVPKGFFRAVFGVPRMRASVCSVVTLQYAFPLNPLKSQENAFTLIVLRTKSPTRPSAAQAHPWTVDGSCSFHRHQRTLPS